MNELELVEAVNSTWALVTSAIGLYISVTSAYLVVAYLAGAKLTNSQIKIISSLYIGLAIMIVVGIYTWMTRGTYYSSLLMELDSRASSVNIHYGPIMLTVLFAAGVLVSLKFMWDVRHSKAD